MGASEEKEKWGLGMEGRPLPRSPPLSESLEQANQDEDIKDTVFFLNSWWRLLIFSLQKGAIIRVEAINQERRPFQILLA